MSNSLKYSIIYAVIRSEISEKLSVGLIIVEDGKVSVRYSRKKLDVLQSLYSEDEYKFVTKVVQSLYHRKAIDSQEAVNYLTRYSNNLIAVSQLQGIDLPPSNQSKEWLFRNYVYAGARERQGKS